MVSRLRIAARAACMVFALCALGGCTPTDLTGPEGMPPTSDQAGTNPGTTPDTTPDAASSPLIRGTLSLSPASARQLPEGQAAPPPGREVEFDSVEGCLVVAVSEATGQAYRGTAAADGSFEIALPESENGSSFVLTILGPDGKPLGPVLLGTANGAGLTGLHPQGELNLGSLAIPANLGDGPIMVDGPLPEGTVDNGLQTRVGDNGVPVGVNSFGKGDEALNGQPGPEGLDSDQDGLVDLFDADDDGNGRVDDFETGAQSWALPNGEPARANFFTNLKIPVEDAEVYYHGTPDMIDGALATQTVITFECVNEPAATKTITGAHLVSSPAPSYLPLTSILGTGTLWSESGYAFNPRSDRYDAFITPNAVLEAGDTFTVEVAFSDGTTAQYSRMLNYILKNIPRLVKYGPPDALLAYDPGSPANFGTGNNPVAFDPTQDLVLEFQPPVDEAGAILEGFTYGFHVFYYDAASFPLDTSNLDVSATWPAPPAGFTPGQNYSVPASDPRLAALSADNTYTLTIPAGVLPTQLVKTDASVVNVARYKIDITAECPSGNSAICIFFER